MGYIKLGNTWFINNLGKKMSFARFKALYSGSSFSGMSYEEAYEALGGKIPKDKDEGKESPKLKDKGKEGLN